MKAKDIEFFRNTLKAASPHYPGFEQGAMHRNIDELCDQALKAAPEKSTCGFCVHSSARQNKGFEPIFHCQRPEGLMMDCRVPPGWGCTEFEPMPE